LHSRGPDLRILGGDVEAFEEARAEEDEEE